MAHLCAYFNFSIFSRIDGFLFKELNKKAPKQLV